MEKATAMLRTAARYALVGVAEALILIARGAGKCERYLRGVSGVQPDAATYPGRFVAWHIMAGFCDMAALIARGAAWLADQARRVARGLE